MPPWGMSYLRKCKQAKRPDFYELLTSKLGAVLAPEKKANKVGNLLQAMKRGRVPRGLPNPSVDILNRSLKSPQFVIWGARKQHALLEKIQIIQ